MVKTVIITHINCADGYTAAWVVWKKYGISSKISYHGIHPNAPWSSYPDVEGKRVFMFDVSPTMDAYLKLVKHTKSFHVFDHHISNYRALKSMPNITFDMDHCGAYIAWKHVYPKKKIPLLIQYIEDNDMGWWKLKGSSQLVSALSINFKLHFTDECFKAWDKLNNKKSIAHWMQVGKHYEHLLSYLVQSMDNKIQLRYLDGYKVGLIECQFRKPLSSHLANYIANNFEVDFAAIISGEENNRVMMRSANKNVDLSVIAKKYGTGGGHPGAASMTIKEGYDEIFSRENVS